MKPKLIIFDYDGVIMNSFDFIKKAYDNIAEEYQIDKPNNQEYYLDFFELDWRNTLKKWGIADKNEIDRVVKIYYDTYDKLNNTITPYDGITEVIKKVSEEYCTAIVSNTYRKVILAKLMEFKLEKFFDLILGIEDGDFKPSPDLLIKCMGKLNYEPQDTVFIGDMDGDIIAGKAAKVKKIIAVTYGFHTLRRLKGADIIVNSPSEIIKAVR
ncbi:HAD-IA family hydrolase [Candidatus Woesearchaeota archaeon]|nr:HAD-IA family hydrolase [Candidatus Woesearchaeota archaeon]